LAVSSARRRHRSGAVEQQLRVYDFARGVGFDILGQTVRIGEQSRRPIDIKLRPEAYVTSVLEQPKGAR
jgi:hypothetical protein